MQKLHLVGFTADFDGLIFSARKGAKSGSFVVPVDGRLLKQLAEAERLRGGGGAVRVDEHRLASPRLVRPESSLNPREMQDRIRAGWSVDEVAAEAGVDLDWVRRFAAPVLAEVRRVVERSRDAVYDKPRYGLSSLPLGASVRRNVLDRGVRMLDEELDDCWSAHQLDEGAWIVRFAYTSRGRLQEAEWLYDIETEELSSRNRLASQLGHVARGRKRSTTPVRSAVPQPSAATRQAARRPAPVPVPAAPARPATAKRTAPKKAAPKKAAPKKVAAKKTAAPKKAAPKKVAAKKVAAKKAAPKKAAPKKVAPKKVAAAKRPPARKAPATKVAATRPPVKAAAPRAAVARRTATNRAPAKRAVAGRAPAKKAPERPAPTIARSAAPVIRTSGPARNGSTSPTPDTPARYATAVRQPTPARPPAPPARPPAPAPVLVEAPPAPVVERRPEPARELPVRQQDWPTDPGLPRWEPPEAPPRPLPPPGPTPVPEAVRQAAATPFGDDVEPPRPGAAEVDPDTGLARIDSRRNSRYVSAPPPRPVFRGDVARAGTPEAPAPRRPRRTEPLRGR